MTMVFIGSLRASEKRSLVVPLSFDINSKDGYYFHSGTHREKMELPSKDVGTVRESTLVSHMFSTFLSFRPLW